jgi:hypothetical protein
MVEDWNGGSWVGGPASFRTPVTVVLRPIFYSLETSRQSIPPFHASITPSLQYSNIPLFQCAILW